MALLAFCCFSLVSCDKDEPAGPGNSSTDSGYGEIKPTGLKMANLYEYEQDGPTELKIPGFPPLIFNFGHGNYYGWYPLISPEGGLLDCGITESMNSFKWTETNSGFSNSVPLRDRYGKNQYGTSMIYRVKISKVDEYPERYAYARIRFIDMLYSNSGSIIGCALEYESPYTPLK